MVGAVIEALIGFLQSGSTVVVSIYMLLLSFFFPLLFMRFWGKSGLYCYTVIAIITANVQILKLVEFPFFPSPVALGSIVFGSTFLSLDLINEYYGEEAAKKGVWIGFGSMAAWTLLLVLTLGYEPSPADGMHRSMEKLFTPMPAFLFASLIAYLVSSYSNVILYSICKRLFPYLWVRNNISTSISLLVDNTVFSIFAFWIFAVDPVPFGVLFTTYIFGTYIFRVLIALLDTPFLYLSRFFYKE